MVHHFKQRTRYISLLFYLVVGDGNLVLLASRLVAGRHVQNTISINVKGNLKYITTIKHEENEQEYLQKRIKELTFSGKQ